MKQRANRRQSGAPTITDVARQAGVSPMTVSRVINDEKNVRNSTRRAVQAVIDSLGYSPNPAARSLAGADPIRVGLLHENPRTSYVSAFLIGGLQQSSRRGVQLVVRQCATPDEGENAIRRFAATGIDGVVLPPPLSEWRPVLDAIVAEDVPAVLVATREPQSAYSVVGIDDVHAAEAMVGHLVGLGHRRIGFITGDMEQEAAARRLAGYRAALARADIAWDEALVARGRFSYFSGLAAAAELLDLDRPPTAIFASNDDMAAAAVAVAHQRGLEVPRNLTVCGFDDSAIAETMWPELTTIRQPIARMSRTAIDHVIDRIRARRDGRRAPGEHILLDYQLVRRQSDAAPPASAR